MNTTLVDLHVHTTCSDGTFPPAAIFSRIRERQIEYFCIADHDNMDAYPVPEDLREQCISGLEIDTHLEGATVHLLGYGIEVAGSALFGMLSAQRQSRESRAGLIIDRLNKLGVPLTLEDVRRACGVSRSLGRPHIGRALVALEYCSDLQEAFDSYLAEGCSAYVPLERLTTGEAIDLIHDAGGVAVLAHPKRLQRATDLQRLCELPIDGIEVAHPSANQEYRDFLFKLTDERDLIATGGTDFHGRPSDEPIGISFPRFRVAKLLKRLSEGAQVDAR